jgi:phage shock protein C
MNDRLYRSRDDRIISGVAAGVAERLDLDPSLVRVGWAILMVLTGGLAFLVYLVLWAVTPEEPPEAAMGTGRAGPAGPAFGAPPPGPGVAGFTATGSPASADPTPTPGSPAPGVGPSGTSPGWAPGASDWRDQRRAERDARRAARRARREGRDSGSGALVAGAVLVLLGVYFLARQYLPGIEVDRLWPAALVVIGVLLVLRSFSRPGQ